MKFLTEPKKAQLKRDNGKQARPEDVAKLTISDLIQRVNIAERWGFTREEATTLIEGAFAWWQKYNQEQMNEQENGPRQSTGDGSTIDEAKAEEHRGESTSDPV